MYKITVEDENGLTHVWEDVLDYNFIDIDFCQDIANSNYNTELTEDELEEIEDYCGNCERLPDTDDINSFINNLINDRE